jgi:hypothetical protein
MGYGEWSRLGVRFNREYEDILLDFSAALAELEDSAAFVEMSIADWRKLKPKERIEIAQTVADDLFFALGDEPVLSFGDTQVVYDNQLHRLSIIKSDKSTVVINLI